MAGSLEFIKSASGTSVTNLSVTDCFSADYEVYYVSMTKLDKSTEEWTNVKLVNASGVTSGSNYDNARLQVSSYTTFGEHRVTGQTSWTNITFQSIGTADGVGFGMYIFNPSDSSSYTFMKHQASSFYSSQGMVGTKGIGVYKVAEAITGVNILSSNNFDNITINVYGVK